MKFGIFIYEGVEPIDLATIGVLSMAKRVAPSIQFCVIAQKKGPVLLSNGFTVLADFGIDDAPELDVLIVTGGPGWVAEAAVPSVLEFVRKAANSATVASVCTGGMILAASGVLDGLSATTKREVVDPEKPPIEVMRSNYPDISVLEASLVDNGRIVTGGGVSLCIDATLYLLEKLLGKNCAVETARIMEYSNAWGANREKFPPIILSGGQVSSGTQM